MEGERKALLEELQVVDKQLAELRHEYMTRPMPFRRPWRFNPIAFLKSVVVLYLLLGATGVWLIFDRGNNWSDLGVGLVVGALFGVGSLIAAMWEAAFNWWSSLAALEYEPENDTIRECNRRVLEIQQRLVDLDATDDTPTS